MQSDVLGLRKIKICFKTVKNKFLDKEVKGLSCEVNLNYKKQKCS